MGHRRVATWSAAGGLGQAEEEALALEGGGVNGAIVGTSLKHGGAVANRINPQRVKRLAQVIRAMG